MKFLIVAIIVFLSACERVDNEPKTSPSPDLKSQLEKRKAEVLFWAKTCDGNVASDRNDFHDIDPAGCDTGDSTLFNGLMCLSGHIVMCPAVTIAQDKNGRWWRSNYYVDKQDVDSFSRDMSLGVLAYLVKMKDQEAAVAWLKWIQDNGNQLCTNDSDGRCVITPTIWGLMYHVWDYIGLKPTNEMLAGNIGDDTTIVTQAATAPLGFQLHLAAIQIYLRQAMGKMAPVLQEGARQLVKRQPNNPFFMWLNNEPTDAIARVVLDKCPASSPARRSQWAWQRDEAEQAWLESNGWDCQFMFNLLLK